MLDSTSVWTTVSLSSDTITVIVIISTFVWWLLRTILSAHQAASFWTSSLAQKKAAESRHWRLGISESEDGRYAAIHDDVHEDEPKVHSDMKQHHTQPVGHLHVSPTAGL